MTTSNDCHLCGSWASFYNWGCVNQQIYPVSNFRQSFHITNAIKTNHQQLVVGCGHCSELQPSQYFLFPMKSSSVSRPAGARESRRGRELCQQSAQRWVTSASVAVTAAAATAGCDATVARPGECPVYTRQQ